MEAPTEITGWSENVTSECRGSNSLGIDSRGELWIRDIVIGGKREGRIIVSFQRIFRQVLRSESYSNIPGALIWSAKAQKPRFEGLLPSSWAASHKVHVIDEDRHMPEAGNRGLLSLGWTH